MKAVLCSRNPHKAREPERLLPGWTIEPLDRDDYPPETGATYHDNALIKAAFGRAQTQAADWVLAEDSGIEVAALDGRPGVLSARYAPEGAPAVARLLGELEGVEDRRARYVCELVLLAPDPDGRELGGRASSKGGSRTSRPAARASATTRSSSPTARSEPCASSATGGRPRTPIARVPPARCSASTAATWAAEGRSVPRKT